jgi:glycosyltransferase involved in cell wall biosynthesis
MGTTCTLTIGMPVFNGERYIGAAIDSILRQTFDDFRLIVLDNASTDRTAAIVQQYVRRDHRVRYRRNERNIGAGPNFNRVFALSESPYFKWAAHDDELKPTYLEKCIRALDSDPDAVLAHSHVAVIDAGGNVVDHYLPLPADIESRQRLRRFASRVLRRGWCTEIFGVVRAEKLVGTRLIASFAAADLALITELSLRGRFIVIPEPLFLSRVHSARYTTAIFENARRGVGGHEEILRWYDTSKQDQRGQMHWWILLGEYFHMINRNIDRWPERLGYYAVAIRWLTIKINRRDLAKDILLAISPELFRWVMRMKRSTSAGTLRGP